MKSLKLLAIGLFIVAALRLCFAVWEYSEKKSPSPKTAQAQALHPKTKSFIEIPPEARARLLENIKQVKPGWHMEEVLELLGRPIFPGEKPSTQPAEQIKIRAASTVLTYYIRKMKEDEFDEEHDEHIHIFMDHDDYVRQIYIKERGKPFVPPPLPGFYKPKLKEGEKPPLPSPMKSK